MKRKKLLFTTLFLLAILGRSALALAPNSSLENGPEKSLEWLEEQLTSKTLSLAQIQTLLPKAEKHSNRKLVGFVLYSLFLREFSSTTSLFDHLEFGERMKARLLLRRATQSFYVDLFLNKNASHADKDLALGVLKETILVNNKTYEILAEEGEVVAASAMSRETMDKLVDFLQEPSEDPLVRHRKNQVIDLVEMINPYSATFLKMRFRLSNTSIHLAEKILGLIKERLQASYQQLVQTNQTHRFDPFEEIKEMSLPYGYSLRKDHPRNPEEEHDLMVFGSDNPKAPILFIYAYSIYADRERPSGKS